MTSSVTGRAPCCRCGASQTTRPVASRFASTSPPPPHTHRSPFIPLTFTPIVQLQYVVQPCPHTQTHQTKSATCIALWFGNVPSMVR